VTPRGKPPEEGGLGEDAWDGDDLPETHLADEDYDAYVSREFDPEGRVKDGPGVVPFLVFLILLVLALAFVVLR
jgi:hypothetical protein